MVQPFSGRLRDIANVENILDAWSEFLPGKRSKLDVQEFSLNLMDNILILHRDLIGGTYRHGPYHRFRINDPKPRDIAKASVRDRLLHHAVHRVLCPFFSRRFIADSFSCQLGKGTHRALDRFRAFAYRASRNRMRTCWVLKCDIRKFFASIDHGILADILARHISDEGTLRLLGHIVSSFSPGLPLGNLTSQLLVNIYMHEFDLFVKHQLKAKHYLRYADDFAVLSHDKDWLMELLPKMGDFLQERLKLDLHPNKVSITTLASGVDFLGWVHFPDHRVLRTATKRRMWRQLAENHSAQSRQSYTGMLEHGNAEKEKAKVKSLYTQSPVIAGLCGTIAYMVQLPPAGAFLDTQRIISSVGVTQGQHTADLGCGSGYITMTLARAVGNDGVVTAVDVMEEPLQAVRTKAEAAGLTNVKEVRADLEVLGGTKIPDASQDLSVLANVLFQSQKKDLMIAEAVRMLKPGGRLLVVNWKKGVGGFGPPDELRSDEETLKSLAVANGVRFERPIDAGTYYIGLLFVK